MNVNTILFRAKSTNDNRWVYGYYYYSHRYGSHFIKVSESIEDTDSFIDYDVEVDSKTISLFTGVLDSNGVKIFTNDIVNNHNSNHNSMVYFHSEQGKFVVGPNKSCMTGHVYNGGVKSVIGNTFDNPELMVGDKVKYTNAI